MLKQRIETDWATLEVHGTHVSEQSQERIIVIPKDGQPGYQVTQVEQSRDRVLVIISHNSTNHSIK